jgi:hypothetical protein
VDRLALPRRDKSDPVLDSKSQTFLSRKRSFQALMAPKKERMNRKEDQKEKAKVLINLDSRADEVIKKDRQQMKD